MRWNTHKQDDIEIKKKFAIFPIEINGEVRWLERVNIKYKFVENEHVVVGGGHFVRTGWIPIEFIDK